MPWDGAFKCCEIWVQSNIWAVCRGSNHGKPHDDNYQCFDRCSRKCWVLRVLLPKPNGLDFEYEQAYQFHYQQNLWRQLLRTVCLFDLNELHTKNLMWESFGCSLFAFQIGQYPFVPLLIVEFWRDGKAWSLFVTSRGSLRKDQDPSKTAVNIPRTVSDEADNCWCPGCSGWEPCAKGKGSKGGFRSLCSFPHTSFFQRWTWEWVGEMDKL